MGKMFKDVLKKVFAYNPPFCLDHPSVVNQRMLGFSMKFIFFFLSLCFSLNFLAADPWINEECFKNQDINCDVVYGEWLPQYPILFRPLAADPRQVTYSAGWRFNDQVLCKNVIPVSFGDTCALYRLYNVWPWCGQLQIEIEGALWAVFCPLSESSPLVNADYYVAIPITYAIPRWSFRLRGFHISSHLGDEFMLQHPSFHRKNPSAEYLDFYVSHDLTDEIRVYSGLGYIVAQDPSYRFHRFYAETGFELRLYRFGFVDACERIYGTPIYAADLRYRGDFKRHMDMTYIVGYEWGKLYGQEKRLRIYLEYHDGYSLEGQFQRCATNYLAIKASYGY